MTKAEWIAQGLSLNSYCFTYRFENFYGSGYKLDQTVFAKDEAQARFNFFTLLQECYRKQDYIIHYLDIDILNVFCHPVTWCCYADDEELPELPIYPDGIYLTDLERALLTHKKLESQVAL